MPAGMRIYGRDNTGLAPVVRTSLPPALTGPVRTAALFRWRWHTGDGLVYSPCPRPFYSTAIRPPVQAARLIPYYAHRGFPALAPRDINAIKEKRPDDYPAPVSAKVIEVNSDLIANRYPLEIIT